MAKNKNTTPSFSDGISAMCKLLEDAEKDYTWNSDKIVEMERLQQDLLHKIELEDLKYKDRAKLSTQLMKCRRERRYHKDTVQILEPLVQYLRTDRGKQLYNLLREVLGKTRKVEERMQNRVYYPRVLPGDPIRK